MNIHTLLSLAIIGVCILLSGFFSGAEMGIVSLNRLRLRHLAEGGLRQAKIVQELLNDRVRFLTVILIGNNVVLVTATAIATSVFENHLFLTNLVLFILIFVFGEIVPKGLFSQYPNTLTLSLAGPIKASYLVLLPIANIARGISSLFVRLEDRTSPFMSRREFRLLLREGKRDGVVDGENLQMLEAVLDLPTLRVKEVMTPRINMVCVGEAAGIDEMLSLLKRDQYARLPVYRDGIDDITGVLYIKDLADLLGGDLSIHTRNLILAKDLAHPAYFVPETMPLPRLLREFRKRNLHIAVVVDEYGGTAGLVTMEDLLEEIVGDIQDEHDLTSEWLYKGIGEGVYLVKARADITHLNEELGLNLPQEGLRTIAGLVLERLGRIPPPGESIRFEGVTLTVLKADKKCISLFKVESRE